MTIPDWAHAHGPPLFLATIRSVAEDFDVTEELGVEFSGAGEHDFLYVKKKAANTEWVARQLASFADVPARDVGYSGLKDRHAVTRQWFSVPRWNKPDWGKTEIEGVEIAAVERHHRKLHRGTHKANRFRIVLRGVSAGVRNPAALSGRLRQIDENGVPNYFGQQRFGRGGSNLALANQWSSGARVPRQKRSLAISTARSYLFNQMLAERVTRKSWNRMQAGDVANLDGTRSVFAVDAVDEDIVSRCREMDIHPTALLWGEGASDSNIPPGYENWLDALSKARVKPLQRSLRLRVSDLAWEIMDDKLVLEFKLGRGAFATSVLREIADVVEADR